MRLTLLLLLVVLAFMAFSLPAIGQPDAVPPDTVASPVAVKATADSGPTLLDRIASLMAALTPILSFLVGTGLVLKYVPFLAKLPNFLIPFLNTLIAFLAVFNGPAPANAGIFGDFVHSLSLPAKTMGSVLLAAGARALYETYLRPVLEKFGIYRAGITPEERAVRVKLTQPLVASK